MADFSAQWKKAKATYEKNTDEKKPSKTFLTIRKGTGIDAQLQLLEKAKDWAAAEKAKAGYDKARGAYSPMVRKRMAEEKDKARIPLIKKEGEALLGALSKLDDATDMYVKALHDQDAGKGKVPVDKMNVDQIMRDPVLSKQFYKFMQKEYNEENMDFVLAVHKGMKPQTIFDNWVSPLAKTQANLPDAVVKALTHPIPDGEKDKAKIAEYKKMVHPEPKWAPAIQVIMKALQADVVPRFRKDPLSQIAKKK